MLTKATEKPPESSMLRDWRQFGRMPDAQFDDEVVFWRRVRRTGDEKRVEIANAILQEVLTPVDACRQASLHPPEGGWGPDERHLVALYGFARIGMAMGQLLRRHYGGLFEQFESNEHHGRIFLDKYMTAPVPIFRLYHPRATAGAVLQDYSPGAAEWYEDEALAVRVSEQCASTSDFQEMFSEDNGGKPFPAQDYLTLRPQLKLAFFDQAVPPAS